MTPKHLWLIASLLVLAGCQSLPPMPTVDHVYLSRFMGKWYVIAHIPAASEKDAYNAVESYRLGPDGRIQTSYRFRQGGFDGPLKVMRPTGYVENTHTNAHWGMQFVWPIKAEYLIIYLNTDYTETVIARTKRDYAWIMARTPAIPQADYRHMVSLLAERGYDVSRLRKVPQRWPEKD